MAKKRGLASNRGLDALLGTIKKERQITQSAQSTSVHQDDAGSDAVFASQKISSANSTASHSPATDGVDDNISLVSIDVNCLQSGKYQPRRNMDETALAELANSIRQHGVMQPIVIRPLLANEDKKASQVTHEIIAGERRWRAAKMAGERNIPAIERALSDELAIALALIENIQREDLSVMEQASALQRFHTEFGMSHAMIAEVVGKARTTVSNLLRLNQLNEVVKEQLNNHEIDMGHARALLSLSVEQQPIIAQKIIDQEMTVREAEQLVKSILNPTASKTKQQVTSEREAEMISQKLSDKLGAVVKLKQKKNGKGCVEIFFHDQEELSTLLKQLEIPQ
ncbi:MAG: chromosome partitioning protein ParB [Pseudomonadales bacterium]|nr:MAG: chromosome partitioning protein ParB [Pseudomonadales bacterium]